MLTLPGLPGLGDISSNESGFMELMLSYKTNMDLTYLEVNEKIDRLTDRLPAGMDFRQGVDIFGISGGNLITISIFIGVMKKTV